VVVRRRRVHLGGDVPRDELLAPEALVVLGEELLVYVETEHQTGHLFAVTETAQYDDGGPDLHASSLTYITVCATVVAVLEGTGVVAVGRVALADQLHLLDGLHVGDVRRQRAAVAHVALLLGSRYLRTMPIYIPGPVMAKNQSRVVD
jgi:hypothetical protein